MPIIFLPSAIESRFAVLAAITLAYLGNSFIRIYIFNNFFLYIFTQNLPTS